MKIIQMLPTIAYGDAVGNDCAAIYKILKDDGWDTAIYAENIDYRLPKGFAHRVSDMPSLSANDILIYQNGKSFIKASLFFDSDAEVKY